MKNHFLEKALAMLAGITILAGTTIGIASADDACLFARFTRMVVFGDSLSDVGNLPAMTFLTPGGTLGLVIPPPPRYDRGRFSNGPVAVEYLAKKYRLRLTPSLTGFGPTDSVSFAYGGAGTGISSVTPGGFPVPGLLGQVNHYIAKANQARQNSSTLFVIWSGANDYLVPLLSGAPPGSIDPRKTVDNIATAILTLHAHGARYFLIPNLPDLGKIPLCLPMGACSTLSTLTNTHNSLLRQTLTNLEATQRNIELIPFNAYQVFEEVRTHPHRYGFSGNVQAPGPASGCLLQNPAAFDPANCDRVNFHTNQLFWDEQHPTTRMHKIWGQGMWRAVLTEGIPPFLWHNHLSRRPEEFLGCEWERAMDDE